MTDQRRLGYVIDVEGADVAAAELEQVGGAMQGLSIDSMETASRFSGLAGASGALGSILSRTTPEIGAMASALGTAGGATSGFVAALGGPMGLAAGGLVAVLGLAVTWFNMTEEAAADYGDENERLIGITSQLEKETRKLAAAEAARQQQLRIASGQGTEFETQAQINKLKDQLAAQEKERDEFAKRFGLLPGARRLPEQVMQTTFAGGQAFRAPRKVTPEEQLSFINLADSASKTREQLDFLSKRMEEMRQPIEPVPTILGEDFEGPGFRARKKRGRKKGAGFDFGLDDPGLIREIDFTQQTELEKDEGFFDSKIDIEEDYFDRRKELSEDYTIFTLGGIVTITEAEIEAAEERLAAQEAAQQKVTDAMMGGLDILKGGFNKMAADVIMGEELNLKSILKMMGTAVVQKKIKNLWVAGGLLINPYTAGNGGALLAYAAAEIAAGAAMGAASRGGGGGGGAQRPARPTATGAADRTVVDPQPTEIHVHTLTPTMDAAIAIDRSVRMLNDKQGPRS
jgi:hypothetical protein